MRRKFDIGATLGAVTVFTGAFLFFGPTSGETAAPPTATATAAASLLASAPPPGTHQVTIPLAPRPYPAQCPNGYVAITFDNGPIPGYTNEIVAVLARYGVKATFFDWGDRAQANPSLVKEQAQHGWVENHTYDHPDLEALTPVQQLTQMSSTDGIIKHITGVEPYLMRPPLDDVDWQIAHEASSLGLTWVSWTTDTYDYTVDGDTAALVEANAAKVQPGGILLFHDGYQWVIDALPTVIKDLAARGLCAGKIVPSSNPTITSWDETFYAEVGHW
jgi:peptidoglycan/xylan/chitin deacetylase (PgdA/CDA1 family)